MDDGDDYHSSFDEKWSKEIRKNAGFTMIPNLLIMYIGILKITPAEFMVLVNIESYRWDENAKAYPSIKTLALRMGISQRQVTRIVTSLENKGYIKRIPRQGTSNIYSLEPLIEELNSLSDIGMEDNEEAEPELPDIPDSLLDIFDTPNGQKRQEGADITDGEVVTNMSDKEDTLKLNTGNEMKSKMSEFSIFEDIGQEIIKI